MSCRRQGDTHHQLELAPSQPFGGSRWRTRELLFRSLAGDVDDWQVEYRELGLASPQRYATRRARTRHAGIGPTAIRLLDEGLPRCVPWIDALAWVALVVCVFLAAALVLAAGYLITGLPFDVGIYLVLLGLVTAVTGACGLIWLCATRLLRRRSRSTQ